MNVSTQTSPSFSVGTQTEEEVDSSPPLTFSSTVHEKPKSEKKTVLEEETEETEEVRSEFEEIPFSRLPPSHLHKMEFNPNSPQKTKKTPQKPYIEHEAESFAFISSPRITEFTDSPKKWISSSQNSPTQNNWNRTLFKPTIVPPTQDFSSPEVHQIGYLVKRPSIEQLVKLEHLVETRVEIFLFFFFSQAFFF